MYVFSPLLPPPFFFFFFLKFPLFPTLLYLDIKTINPLDNSLFIKRGEIKKKKKKKKKEREREGKKKGGNK